MRLAKNKRKNLLCLSKLLDKLVGVAKSFEYKSTENIKYVSVKVIPSDVGCSSATV